MARGPGYVLYALMDAVVDRYFPLLHAVETELERIEAQILADSAPRANIEALRTLAIDMRWLQHDDTVISQARQLRRDIAHLSRS